MRVLFLGNHTVGVTALAALLDAGADVGGVVAHPPDPEDGVRYESLFEFARDRGLEVIRSTGRDSGLRNFVAAARPELLWITDYRYLLPGEIVESAVHGAVNLHPSLLPRYRGRAPINWAIINGERRLGLTAHFVDEGMDTGDIIEQHAFELGDDEDVAVALARLMPLYDAVSRSVFDAFCRGTVSRRPQDHARATSYPRRTPEDGRLNWRDSAVRVKDFVRALARPYPGAFTELRGVRCALWRARVEPDAPDAPAGTVLECGRDDLLVSTGDGAVRVTDFTWAGDRNGMPRPGDRFESA